MAYPLVSVLTPVHETGLFLLLRAFESVKAQGFSDNDLEWVMILHNCSGDYKKSVYDRFGPVPYVIIREVDLPGTGLACARSNTLKAASGKYLFFLDGDDELAPHCLEKVVKAMEETNADTAVYSAFVKIGQGGFGCFCDADPREGRLLLDRGDPRIGSTLCYSGVSVWTRACRRSFLKDKNIDFDLMCPNHITDPIFNFEVALAANKTLILPGLIGYIYYYGMGMMVSDKERASTDLLDMFDRYFNKYRPEGLSADNLMWFFLLLFFILSGETKTSKDSDIIRKVREYANALEPSSMTWQYLQRGAGQIYDDVIHRIRSM